MSTTPTKLADLIETRLLGVPADDQDLELENDDWRMIIDALRTTPATTPASDARLREAVIKARDTFKRYAQLHYDKRTDDGDTKGEANILLAAEMDIALASTEPASPADDVLREALARTQWMLETIDRTHSTNFAEVRERLIANRAALSTVPVPTSMGEGK